MKTVLYHEFGDANVLQVLECDSPRPRKAQVRVRVHAAGLNPKDILIRKGKMRWLVGQSLPRTPGYDFAGVTMDAAHKLPIGTPVYGMIASQDGGACAEVVRVPSKLLVRKPEHISMIDAASLPLAALTALQALRDHLNVQPGHRVLINGASGGVGTLAVQIARALGAEVTAVCSSRNLDLVRSLGAQHVIDYTSSSVLDVRDMDAFFDVFGNFPWPKAASTLRPGGLFCTTVPRAQAVARTLLFKARLHRASLVVVKSDAEDLKVISEWLNTGAMRAVVDRVYSMDESIEAHQHIESKRARGKVVIKIKSDEG